MASNIRINDLLNALSESEASDFQRFVHSPYFHKGEVSEEILALLDYLLTRHKNRDGEEDFDRKAAYQYIFPNKPFVEKKLEKLLSVLHSMLKRFIATQQQGQVSREFENNILQLSFFRERKLNNRFENLSQQLQDSLAQEMYVSHQTLKNRFLLDYEICYYEQVYAAKRSYLKITETLESLEVTSLQSKLELLNQYLMTQRKALFTPSPEIADIVKNSYFPEMLIARHPILLLSYKIFRLLEQDLPSTADFEALQALFVEHETDVDPDYVRVLYTYLRSLCAILVNNNHPQYLPVLFRLHQAHYKRGYLNQEGMLHPLTLLSVSNTALWLGEMEWAESFIEDNAHSVLNDNSEKDFYALCKANLLFFKGQFDESLAILPASFTLIDFHLFARRLEIKCYFELHSDLLDYKMDAFKMYLSRASKTVIPEQVRERNANFINLLTQINNTVNDDSHRSQKLLTRIESKQLLTDREWLMEKVRMKGQLKQMPG